jgi:hypothetical protein
MKDYRDILEPTIGRSPHCGSHTRQRQQAELENMGWAPSYAEPGYQNDAPEHGILFANWNVFPTSAQEQLESAGYAVEWDDEWTTCEDCGRALRTEPDGWDWNPFFDIDDEDSHIICKSCAADRNHAPDTENV